MMSNRQAAAERSRPPLALLRNIRALEAMVCSFFSLKGDHAFEHHPVELSAVLDVGIRIPEVCLVDVLGLRQHVLRNEPAAAKLPAVCPNLTGDAYEIALGPVVA